VGDARHICFLNDSSSEPLRPDVIAAPVNKGPVATPAGPSGYHLIALLHFDDMAAVQKAFASAEGQATVADIPNFASGGADIFMFDTRQL
jgi:uncharacterized protein (TIGR02118 family)